MLYDINIYFIVFYFHEPVFNLDWIQQKFNFFEILISYLVPEVDLHC